MAELSKPFRVSAPAISKHRRILERAGLVGQRREGRTPQCRLLTGPLKRADEWVARYRLFWNGKLDRFAEYVEQNKKG